MKNFIGFAKSYLIRKNPVKAFINEMGYERTKEAFRQTFDNLGFDYLDLYLVHMPFGDYYGAWRAMEELYKEGRIRAILCAMI